MTFDLSPHSIAISILAAISLYGIVRFFLKRKSSGGETVNYSPMEAIAITVGIYFVSQLVGGLVVGLFAGAMNWDTERLNMQLDSDPRLQFFFILVIEIVCLGLLYWFLKRRKTPWSAIGWVKPKLRDIGYALTGFGIYFAVYAFIIFNLLQQLFPQVDTEQAQQLGFDKATSGPMLIFIFLSLVILPPLVEEILVRGFLFTGLKQKMNIFLAAIVTSIVFAAAHLQWGSGAPLLWAAAADTFTLSMVLVWLRHKTGSLWPGIGVHFIKNGIAFLALFVFKVT